MEPNAKARRRRLPHRQPHRTLIVLTVYALISGGDFAFLRAAFGPIGVLFAIMLACALLLPVALTVPSPGARVVADQPMGPVLQRRRR
jgi:hypothetical protein